MLINLSFCIVSLIFVVLHMKLMFLHLFLEAVHVKKRLASHLHDDFFQYYL